ncbi:MAG TPA: hypothetical protein PLU47_08085 [Azonexus sp.]|nr:hypothetical protein [Azonexus sp.]
MRTESVTTDNASFTIHEMTIAEVRTWVESFNTGGETDVVSELAVEGISLGDLAMLCRCEVSAFDPLTARELKLLADMATEVNTHFFRVRRLIRVTAEHLEKERAAGRLPAIGVSN